MYKVRPDHSKIPSSWPIDGQLHIGDTCIQHRCDTIRTQHSGTKHFAYVVVYSTGTAAIEQVPHTELLDILPVKH